jgi:hypothetical protein
MFPQNFARLVYAALAIFWQLQALFAARFDSSSVKFSSLHYAQVLNGGRHNALEKK